MVILGKFQSSTRSISFCLSETEEFNFLICRTKEEMYRYLSIDIADDSKDTSDRQRTVEKCLNNFFLPEDRELKCEKCEEGQVASQTMRILSRPKALLLHLKRFVLVEKPRTPIETADNEAVEAVVPGVEMTFRKNKVSDYLLALWCCSLSIGF